MRLPERMPMRATMFGSLRDGGHLQVREDAHGLGIAHVLTKQTRRHEWESSMTWEHEFPGREFKTYAELREAALALPGRFRARLLVGRGEG